ncbi:lysosomal-associated transmembrane protein 4A-like isoform X2 [Branchiostoma floridae]|uniref:Lysosomal-associated transmembrane protein 4A-like isoform X2 n=1 Tax=Branchiostoma floridae TaxID=7739 RepID=A0A9J7KN68_BRAFL|nr:lysosomal-associated transmembrane protein 4A-like isoform X2 [Branchiostoma floridae]
MQAKEGMKRGESRCCCGCLHVRAGAIMIGLLHLVCHLLGMLILAYLITHPEAMPKGDTWYSLNYNGNDTTRGSDNCVALAITFFTFTMTLLMLYGAIKHRAGYLLPFFCIQVFDFTVGCLTAIGFVSYMPNIRTFMEQNPNLPYREELMAMDPQYLLLICMALFFIVMIIKAYFIGVVWGCYKYITSRNLMEVIYCPDTEALLPMTPPSYDTVTKMPPPPPYTPATET